MTDNSSEFGGRVALITGAGTGIGRTTARRLAAGGAQVVVTDKHEGRMRETTDQLTDGFPQTAIAGYQLDIEDRAQFDDVFARVEREVGPIQIYVWNAALNIPEPVFEQDPERFDRIMYANTNNLWYSCARVVQQMKRAGGGVIVNVGSIAPDSGAAATEPAYAMSKAAGRALINGMVKAGGEFNIRANEVVMGMVTGTRFTDTRPEMQEALVPQVPLGRLGRTEDIAEAIAFLASDRASHISGAVLNVSGGFHVRL